MITEEEKGDEPEGKEEEGWTVVNKAIAYCTSNKFENMVDDFGRDHAQVFEDALDAKADVEHKLEYSALHQEYMQLFESKIEAFIEQEGSTITDFYSECQDILEDKHCALFEEDENKWFVEMLTAVTDYSAFFELMVAKARRMQSK